VTYKGRKNINCPCCTITTQPFSISYIKRNILLLKLQS